MRVKNERNEGFLFLILGILIVVFGLVFLFFIQNYTMLLCANWFPIVMIILALTFFVYMKNKSQKGGKK